MMNVALSVEPGARSTGYRALRYSSQAFLRYDRPIRSCLEKNESVEGEAARESNLRLVLLMLLQRRVKGPT